MKQPELTTERLLLRSFKLDDADEVHILAKNFNVSKTTLNIPYPYVTGMAEEWISTHNEIWKTESGVVYAITMLETGQLVGAIELESIDKSLAVLGYWIGEPYWGNGYCTEAAVSLIQFSFEKLGLSKVIAEHLTTNPASGKVMKKVGMHHIESTQKADRYREMVGMEIYGIRKILQTHAAGSATRYAFC